MSRSSPKHRKAAEKDNPDALVWARQAAVAGMRATLSWQVLRTVLKLAFAASLAIFAGNMIELGIVSVSALVIGVSALPLAALAGLMADRRQASAEAEVAQNIRADVQDKLENMTAHDVQTRPAGALIAGLQRHPESLAALVVAHRAAALMLGIGPLLAAVAVLAVSWEAALTLLLASPIMIVFFVLVGGTIHNRATAQEKAFGQLAAQFEDRIRTLPTILASHGLDREQMKLETRMRTYAQSTMGVLKVAFLNAGIIDFFSSLSIAVLAVFLGLGHLKLIHTPGFSDMQLWQSLFILMLAPEFFSPFRRYAEQYHAKAEGNAAAAALDDLLGTVPVATGTADVRLPALDRFRHHAGFRLPAKGLVAITGPSGSGKSTLLRRLAGVEPSDVSIPEVAVRVGIDWISTDVHVPAGTLAGALSWNRAPVCPTKLLLAASRVGLLDDRMLPGGLGARIKAGGENLSGGQRLRIGVARTLLSTRVIFADEPTAKLDPVNAGRVRLALFDCARDRLVIVATHDPELAKCADTVLSLDEQPATRREIAI
jgi:ATP-binding cassette subfamily C protein